MKKNCLFLLLFSFFSTAALEKKSKIVALLAGRNERIFMRQCLEALSLYADAIVYLDDASDDETLDIVRELAERCKVERIIEKKEWYRSESVDKNRLLEAGREIGGTHFIVLDADEMFTANCLKNDYLRKKILTLKPGDTLYMPWLHVWESPYFYRSDKQGRFFSLNGGKFFIFCDNGFAFYADSFLHVDRFPSQGLKGEQYEIDTPNYGVIHFQFVNMRNLEMKQAWYQCLERIRIPEKSPQRISKRYSWYKEQVGRKKTEFDSKKQKKNHHKVPLAPVPKDWYDGYNFFDPAVFRQKEEWRENQILGWFKEYGKEYFEGLNIWNLFPHYKN